MVDSKSVVTQVDDLHVIIKETEAEGINLGKSFQEVTII